VVQRSRADACQRSGYTGDRVDEVVVTGCRYGHDHHERVGDEKDAQHAARGSAEADDRDEKAPTDVHARHRGIGVEADPGERAGVVSGHPHGVCDPEAGNEPGRRRGVEDVEHDGYPE
jgi:hypothetical protein